MKQSSKKKKKKMLMDFFFSGRQQLLPTVKGNTTKLIFTYTQNKASITKSGGKIKKYFPPDELGKSILYPHQKL